MSQIIIQNGNQSKTIEQDDFPIRIGTDLNSEILISGSLAEGLSATIDRIGDKYLLQITNQSIDALMNGDRFKGSHWIESDDELKINNAVIQFGHQGDNLLILVSDISGEQPTIFEKRQSKGLFENQTIRYIGLSIALAVLYFSFYFFTAKAVKIDVFDDLNGESITQESAINIDGGLFPAFKIGGRYLLRSGEYKISILNEGYVSVDEGNLIIDENESQDRMFDLRRLPGKIAFITNPSVDFDLYVDDSEVSKITPEIFVFAGNRKIELRFEKYFSINKEIFVNGKFHEEFNNCFNDFLKLINNINNWEYDIINLEIKDFLKNKNIKFPVLGKPIRYLLTNNYNGPSITDIFMILGKAESLKRLNKYNI